MKPYKAILLIICILILDQTLKLWVKTHMIIGEQIIITNWFRLHFTENPGMAFGMMLPGVWGKLFLSVFRLAATAGGVWFIVRLFKQKAHWGFITACCMILAGALGNMIDGTFYGMLFSDSYGRVAQVLPKEGGYAGFMQGLVVDMLWFPLIHGSFPDWFPIWKGEPFEFFRFIFNIADASITCGVFVILIFQKSFFKEPVHTEEVASEQQVENLVPENIDGNKSGDNSGN